MDTLQELNLPGDCFLSLRVNDTQKISRLSASRVYSFPKLGERKFGKIEVFRRVGVCSIDIDPRYPSTREVHLDCRDTEIGSIGLRVGIEADEGTKKKVKTEASTKKPSSRVKAAKEYLSQHSLDVQLSEAMQAVLRERPVNPTEFLAAELLKKYEMQPPPRVVPVDQMKGMSEIPISDGMDNKNNIKVEQFACQPSVGTWFRPNPGRRTSPFQFLPSVGTWIAPVEIRKLGWFMRPVTCLPSVGTWLAPNSRAASVVKTSLHCAYKHTPSVSNWSLVVSKPPGAGGLSQSKATVFLPSAESLLSLEEDRGVPQDPVSPTHDLLNSEPKEAPMFDLHCQATSDKTKASSSVVTTTLSLYGPGFFRCGLRPSICIL